MRKLLLLTIAICFSIFAEAQITGGGSETPPPPPEIPVVSKPTKNGHNYFLFSLASPGGKFKDDGGSTGGALGITSFAPIYTFQEGLDAGIYHGFTLQINGMEADFIETINTPFIFADYLLGPSVDYQFAEGFGVMAFFRLGPMIGGGPDYNTISGDNIYNEGIAFGLGTGFGFNLNLNNFIIGLEFTGGQHTYKFQTNTETDVESDVNVGTTRISIGAAF